MVVSNAPPRPGRYAGIICSPATPGRQTLRSELVALFALDRLALCPARSGVQDEQRLVSGWAAEDADAKDAIRGAPPPVAC